MKKLVFLLFTSTLLISCVTSREVTNPSSEYSTRDNESITQSLFNEKNSSISEENIQKILNGNFKLSENLRVAIVKLESNAFQRKYYWTDEEYLKTQQSYLDLFTKNLKNSGKVKTVKLIPDLLISNNLSFTNIREAAIRTQSDIVVVYSISSDIYSRYKMFSKTDIKAFATTQLIIMDVKTGLIPFTTIVTKDVQSKKQENELNDSEAINRTKNEAVLSTINEIGEQMNDFLKSN